MKTYFNLVESAPTPQLLGSKEISGIFKDRKIIKDPHLIKNKFPFLVLFVQNNLGKPIMKAVRKLPHFHSIILTLLFYTLTLWCMKELYYYFTLIKAILTK